MTMCQTKFWKYCYCFPPPKMDIIGIIFLVLIFKVHLKVLQLRE